LTTHTVVVKVGLPEEDIPCLHGVLPPKATKLELTSVPVK
jgi:hypothetical protein